jgi:hypothetical protein
MATLYRGPKRGYKLTEEDRTILAAAIWGEAGPNPSEAEAAANCWGLMMRFMLVDRIWLKSGWTFGKFIRAFSQPTNPLWLDPNGKKCLQSPARCTPSQIARRQMIQAYLEPAMTTDDGWAGLSVKVPLATQFAQRFVDGDLDNPFPEPVYDFAACFLTQKHKDIGIRPGVGLNIDNQCFLTYSDLNAEEKSDVIPGRVHSGAAAHASALTYLAIGTAAGAAAWIWARFWG